MDVVRDVSLCNCGMGGLPVGCHCGGACSPHALPLEEDISTGRASKVEELLAPRVWGIWDDDPKDASFACKISFSSRRWLLVTRNSSLSLSAQVSSHSMSSTDRRCRRRSWESTRLYRARWYMCAWAVDARARCAPYSAHMAQQDPWVMYGSSGCTPQQASSCDCERQCLPRALLLAQWGEGEWWCFQQPSPFSRYRVRLVLLVSANRQSGG